MQSVLCCTFPGNLRGAAWRGLTLQTQASACTPGSPHSQPGPETGVGAERSSQGQREAPRAREQGLDMPGLPLLGSGCVWDAHEGAGGRIKQAGLRKRPKEQSLSRSTQTHYTPPNPKTVQGDKKEGWGQEAASVFRLRTLGFRMNRKRTDSGVELSELGSNAIASKLCVSGQVA